MITNSKKFYISKQDFFSPLLEMYGYVIHGENNVSVIETVTIRKLKEEELNSRQNPFLILTPTDAQQIMDSLWDCGVRPSEGSGSAGALLATQNHLKDMQQLVFKFVDKLK